MFFFIVCKETQPENEVPFSVDFLMPSFTLRLFCVFYFESVYDIVLIGSHAWEK